jgi:Spy/CpxP family protein refolding chaperone
VEKRTESVAAQVAGKSKGYVPAMGFGFGPGGFGGPPQPGQILVPPVQDQLKLTADQKKKLEELQKEADAQLEKILTDDQKKQLKAMRQGPGPGGPPGGGPGRSPQPPD